MSGAGCSPTGRPRPCGIRPRCSRPTENATPPTPSASCGPPTAGCCWRSPRRTSAHLIEPDLPALDYQQATARLTYLAEAAIRAALAVAEAEVGAARDKCRLAVIAMGKSGGRELNYVCDVDVLFVADGDLDVATRLASRMMRVAGECLLRGRRRAAPGRQGRAAGPHPRRAHVSYYKRWARTWEFQALLKARPIAGDPELGQAVPRRRPPDGVDGGRPGQLRRRRAGHAPPRRGPRAVRASLDRELKLGRGGLRDVEFAVQLLQLVHGRNDEALRLGSTVDALAMLGDRGYVGRNDAAELGESYRFLRMLEHRLQLQRLRRTHLFPADDDTDELRWLARAAGVKPARGKPESQVLLEEFRRHAAPHPPAAREAVLPAAAGGRGAACRRTRCG